MSGRMSKNKGKTGEREAANVLGLLLGTELRRSQQYAGINGDADIVGVPGLHLEVKRSEKLDIYGSLDQSIRDAADGEVPVVMHRRNRKQWLLVMQCQDIVEFARAVVAQADGANDPEPVAKFKAARVKKAVRIRP